MNLIIKGFVCGSHTNNHLTDMDGNIMCGTKSRYGMDCHTDIQIFKDCEFVKEKIEGVWQFIKWHLPLKSLITCKKCQKYILKQRKPE